MKKFIIVCLIIFSSCDLCQDTGRSNIGYQLDVRAPIYYSIAGSKFRELSNKTIKINKGGDLWLSKSPKKEDIFYGIYLDYFFFPSTELIARDQIRRGGIVIESIYLNNGWKKILQNKKYIYKLTVDEDLMSRKNINIITEDDISILREIEFFGTTLFYMVADNNLYKNAIEDINKIEEGYRGYGEVFIYFDGANGSEFSEAVLLRVKNDYTDKIKSDVVARYGEVDSSSKGLIEKILSDVSKYSLNNRSLLGTIVYWSHGTGWLPDWQKETSMPLAFGYDETSNSRLDIKNIVFRGKIIFDSCRMANVEVFSEVYPYEISFIAPATDIAPNSFPYDNPEFMKKLQYANIINYVSKEDSFTRLKTIADDIVDYNIKQNKEISIVCKNFANIGNFTLKKLFEDFLKTKVDVSNPATKLDFSTIRANLKPYINVAPTEAVFFYDFYDFVKKLNGGNDVEQIKTHLEENYYVRSTPTILEGKPSSEYCGISCYVPYHITETSSADIKKINEYFLGLNWARETNFENYIKPIR